MPHRVLGIDPGFDRVGVAVVEANSLLHSECIETNRKLSHSERLAQIGETISKLIKKWKPQALAIERLFFNQNVNTALKVSEARGVILYEAARNSMDVYEYGPQDVKIAVTGYGKADKRQVEAMTLRILGSKKAPKHDDETDAIALCITHLASVRSR